MRTLAIFTPLLFAILLIGCIVDSGTDPRDPGTFEITIQQNNESKTISGEAFFGFEWNPLTRQRAFTIWMLTQATDTETSEGVILGQLGFDVPFPGEYEITEFVEEGGNFDSESFYAAYVEGADFFPSFSGLITITEATQLEIVGTFEFYTEDDAEEEEIEKITSLTKSISENGLVISGTFQAVAENF